jgi:hypothetical protein
MGWVNSLALAKRALDPHCLALRKLEKARADSGFLNADNFVDIEYIGIVAANSVQ